MRTGQLIKALDSYLKLITINRPYPSVIVQSCNFSQPVYYLSATEYQDLIYKYKIILVWWIWIALSFSLSVQIKQHVDMLVNCLFVTAMWMFESIFLETALLKFGIACQQQWKTLSVCESLNPLLSVLTCRSM